MNKKISVLFLLIALLPITLFLLGDSYTNEIDSFSVHQNDKEIFLSYAYGILDGYFSNDSDNTMEPMDLISDDMKYNILFITLLNNGTVRGCQSGSTQRSHPDRVFLDIDEAVTESIEDDRFGGKLTVKEIDDIQIMFTFLYDIQWLYNTSYDFLRHNIELGIHSLELLVNNTPVIFKESVPISNNYELDYLLDRLCQKASLEKNCYQSDEVDVFRYDTLTFMGNRSQKITDLYRYNIYLDEQHITEDLIDHRLHLAHDWFTYFVDDETNRFKYQYYPSDDWFSTDNNHVRKLAALWSLTELQLYCNSNESEDIIISMLNYYTSFVKHESDFSHVFIDNESKLANNAFLLMSLLNTPHYPNASRLIDGLSEGILSLQQSNGSFNTYFFSDVNTGVDYYPGEAMLSLMKLYEQKKDDRYVDAVEHAFPYYRSYWLDQKNTAFIPWHTQTYALLFNVTHEEELADFIFEMNDWLIDQYQIRESEYIDEIGGFPLYYPTFSTSVFLEGINDAYLVACLTNDSFHKEKYEQSLKAGVRFVLQTQFTEKNAFYLKNKTAAVGGFRTSLTDNSIRIDNTQHAVMALLKTMENHIFNDAEP